MSHETEARYYKLGNKIYTVTDDEISWVWEKQPAVGFTGLKLSGSAEKGSKAYKEWMAEIDEFGEEQK